MIFDNLPALCVNDLVSEVFSDLQCASPDKCSAVCPPKRQRVRGRELIERVNELQSRPLSVCSSPMLPCRNLHLSTIGIDFLTDENSLENSCYQDTLTDSSSGTDNLSDVESEASESNEQNSIDLSDLSEPATELVTVQVAPPDQVAADL